MGPQSAQKAHAAMHYMHMYMLHVHVHVYMSMYMCSHVACGLLCHPIQGGAYLVAQVWKKGREARSDVGSRRDLESGDAARVVQGSVRGKEARDLADAIRRRLKEERDAARIRDRERNEGPDRWAEWSEEMSERDRADRDDESDEHTEEAARASCCASSLSRLSRRSCASLSAS